MHTYFQVGGGIEIRDAGVRIRSARSRGLGGGAGAGDTRRAPVAVGRSSEHDGPDGIPVSDCIVQALHDDGTNNFGLDVAIGIDVEAVAQSGGLPCWRSG